MIKQGRNDSDLRADSGERFANARLLAIGTLGTPSGIGRLAERSLHRIVKYYIEPDESYHEVKHLGYICDIKRGRKISEIQTKSFSRLRPKLTAFLSECEVEVVYPLHRNKSVRYIDSASGEVTPPRRSPKHESVFSAAYELYNIRELLTERGLSVTLMFFESDEFRIRGTRRKIGRRYCTSERVECIPTRLLDSLTLRSPEDYRIFIPEGLPSEFCVADFNRAVGGGFSHGFSVISILLSVGLITEGRRVGRRVLYSVK